METPKIVKISVDRQAGCAGLTRDKTVTPTHQCGLIWLVGRTVNTTRVCLAWAPLNDTVWCSSLTQTWPLLLNLYLSFIRQVKGSHSEPLSRDVG
ncbi:hypothetical protein Pyn_40156 [Prunus yedoensis var. nudiflora]|uniref:Uncharacterized protein n=1 Tax=Prunus yedoensis var. nudiflora TaxID=2094558 RepID=A0A314ZDD9_PRUYE|nr:hypothetical protein Pyn_40156 [Prunus yedoensis var. nudiflora]